VGEPEEGGGGESTKGEEQRVSVERVTDATNEHSDGLESKRANEKKKERMMMIVKALPATVAANDHFDSDGERGGK
jgi:hypothetical protein